jgi:hypothetical protein
MPVCLLLAIICIVSLTCSKWEGETLVRRLRCSRTADTLYQGWRRISGHWVEVRAHEEAKGALAFTLQAPMLGWEEYRCVVPFKELIRLNECGDPQLERPAIQRLGELPALGDDGEADDADHAMEAKSTIATVLHPVMDRLAIRPTAHTLQNHDPRSVTHSSLQCRAVRISRLPRIWSPSQ